MKATVAALVPGNDTQNLIIYRLSRRFLQNMRAQPRTVTEAVAITQKGVLLMHRARVRLSLLAFLASLALQRS